MFTQAKDGAPGVIRTPGTRFRKGSYYTSPLFRMYLFFYFYYGLGESTIMRLLANSLHFGVATIQILYSAKQVIFSCKQGLNSKTEVMTC